MFYNFIHIYIFCAKYVFLIQILVYGVSFIVKKNTKLINYFFFSSIFIPIIYLIIISNFTGYYIEFLNYIVNNLFNTKNLGIIASFDGLTEITYEISQINFFINNFFTDIYVGLTHRALLAEVYLQNIINNQIINDNFLVNIKYHSFQLKQLELQEARMFSNFYNSEFINNFNLYYKECAKFFLRTYECAVNLGFLPITQEYEGIPGHLIVKYEAISQFQTEVILNPKILIHHTINF